MRDNDTWRRWLASGFAAILAGSGLSVSGVPEEAAAAGETVILAAGDIAECDSEGDEATAALLDAQAGTVAMLGDGAYPDGTAAEYVNCYDPSWGRHKVRTRPVPGNHDYVEPGGPGYYGYFGTAAGDPAKGYYSYDVGAWHVVALNSACKEVGGCTDGDAMVEWLRADLAANSSSCTLAYWHHPRYFTTAREPGVGQDDPEDTKMSDVWQVLQADGADVVLSGHRHVYERFARQDSKGNADPSGMRQFVVGTGGGPQARFTALPAPNREAHGDGIWGVLQLTLEPTGYSWAFLPAAGATYTDSGRDSC